MQYDPNLIEHGRVRVTYKEAIHDAEDVTDQWLPKLETSEGKLESDPKGLLFMSQDFVADLSKPAKIETWKHGDTTDAEGLTKKDVWRKSKVLTDILQHRMTDFSPTQKDQWRALNHFHERFKLSDEVPHLPLHLRAGKCVATCF